MDRYEILSKVDHTLLSQGATWEQIKGICDDGIKYGTETWPLSIQEARATSAAATCAHNCWSEERYSCAKAPGSTLYTRDLSEKLLKLCETDMVSSPSIHEHLKRVRYLLKNSADVQ